MSVTVEDSDQEDGEYSSDVYGNGEVDEDVKASGSEKSSSDHEEELNTGDSRGEPSEPIVTDYGLNID
jgi:hypothetical protein